MIAPNISARAFTIASDILKNLSSFAQENTELRCIEEKKILLKTFAAGETLCYQTIRLLSSAFLRSEARWPREEVY